MGQNETLDDIETAWHQAERESDKRALWRVLARGGLLRACREAVQRDDHETLGSWLGANNVTQQDIIQFNGPETAQIARTHLQCGLLACQTREFTQPERQKTLCAAGVSLAAPVGFCSDLIQEFLGEPSRQAERKQSLTVLLVDTIRNEGVTALLTLESLSNGNGGLYPIPEQAFIRDSDFRQAEDNARTYVMGTGIWRADWDVRWRLQRRDGKPLANLTGPSLGAAFALGVEKLFV